MGWGYHHELWLSSDSISLNGTVAASSLFAFLNQPDLQAKLLGPLKGKTLSVFLDKACAYQEEYRYPFGLSASTWVFPALSQESIAAVLHAHEIKVARWQVGKPGTKSRILRWLWPVLGLGIVLLALTGYAWLTLYLSGLETQVAALQQARAQSLQTQRLAKKQLSQQWQARTAQLFQQLKSVSGLQVPVTSVWVGQDTLRIKGAWPVNEAWPDMVPYLSDYFEEELTLKNPVFSRDPTTGNWQFSVDIVEDAG